MFVIALVPFKSHCYFLFIYHVKNIGQVSPSTSRTDLYFRNCDIVKVKGKGTL